MTLLIISLFAFGLALFLGRRYKQSRIWQWIDIIYYPLAAIGVGLLFANTTAQRVLLELSQREDAQRRSLAALVEQQPHIELGISKALVDASFGLVATIPEYAEVCQFSVSLDPRCSVAKKMEPAISDFLKVTRSSLGETLEANLANTCPAADKMILDLSGSSRMSELAGTN